jgi:hypothetical protein
MKRLYAALILAHSWYPQSCCDGKDCHPVPCEEIAEAISNGARQWHGIYFTKNHQYPSPDGQCHICVYAPTQSSSTIGTCMFTPQEVS